MKSGNKFVLAGSDNLTHLSARRPAEQERESNGISGCLYGNDSHPCDRSSLIPVKLIPVKLIPVKMECR
jgi:hypothetical protein